MTPKKNIITGVLSLLLAGLIIAPKSFATTEFTMQLLGIFIPLLAISALAPIVKMALTGKYCLSIFKNTSLVLTFFAVFIHVKNLETQPKRLLPTTILEKCVNGSITERQKRLLKEALDRGLL